ncbi:MAG: hypothetical protein R3Y46_05440 [Opitutales bacterium]
MKTILKISLCLFALSAISLSAAYFYLTNEEVQNEFIQKTLSENFGENVKVDSFKANLSSANITNLKITNDNFDIEAPLVSIQYSSLFSLLFNEINIEDIQIENAKIDIAKKEKPRKRFAEAFVPEENNQAPTVAQIEQKGDTQSPKLEAPKEEIKKNTKKPFNINIKNIKAQISLENKTEKLAKLELNAQDLKLKSPKDLSNLRLEIIASEGLLNQDLKLISQVKASENIRNLELLASSNRQELLKLKLEYSQDFKDLSILSSCKISKEDLAKIFQKSSAFALDIDSFVDIKSKNFFEEVDAILRVDASSGNLICPIEELNFLSNSNLKLNAELKKDSNSLSIKNLDADLFKEGEILAQLKLEKPLEIENNQLADSENLKNFASLYIDNIPYDILRSYLSDYDFSDNKINAHLSLSLDAENKALIIDSKEEIYFKALEILKNEAILIRDVFTGAKLHSSIDLNKNFLADLDLRLIRTKDEEIKAKVSLKSSEEKSIASISATGSVMIFLSTAQVHIDNLEKVKNSTLDLNLDIEKIGEKLEIDNLKLNMHNGDFTLLQAKLSEKLILKNYELQNKNFKAKLIANSLPFSTLKAYVKDIDATSISGEVDIIKSPEELNIKGLAILENWNYSYNNQEIFSGITPSASFDYKKTGDKTKTYIDKFKLEYKGTEILTSYINVETNRGELEKANTKISLYIPALMKVGILENYNNIQSAFAKIDLDFKDNIFSTRTKITNLKLKSENGYIPIIDLDTKIDLSTPEKNFTGLLNITSPQGKSDYSLKSKLSGNKINAELKSINLILDDLIFLAKATSKSVHLEEITTPSISNTYKKQTDAKPSVQERKERAMQFAQKATNAKSSPLPIKTTTKEITTNTKAFWDIGYDLRLQLKLTDIELSGAKIITKLNSNILLDEDSVSIEKTQFTLASSEKGNVKSSLIFDKKQAEPYELKEFSINIPKIDASRLSYNANSGYSMINGTLAIDLNLNSKAKDAKLLVENIQGKASLNNIGRGTISIIDPNSSMGAAADMASSLINIAGGFLGKKAKELNAANTLLETFKNFEYSNFSASIIRDSSLDIKLENLRIDNREISIIGLGRIAYQSGLPINEQDLKVAISAYTQNADISDLFKKANIYEKYLTKEKLHKTKPFLIFGTLEAVETNAGELLGNSAKGAADSFINSFLK